MFTHKLAVSKDCFHAENSIKPGSTLKAQVNQQTGWGLVEMGIYRVEKAGEARKRKGKKQSKYTGLPPSFFYLLFFFYHLLSLGSFCVPSRNRQENARHRHLPVL